MAKDIEAALKYHLVNDAPVNAVVAGSVYPADDVPQDTDPPYITFQRISMQPDVHQTADSTLRRARYQINSYAYGEKAAFDLARLVETALHVFSGEMGATGSKVEVRYAGIDDERSESIAPTDGTARGPHWYMTDYLIWFRTA